MIFFLVEDVEAFFMSDMRSLQSICESDSFELEELLELFNGFPAIRVFHFENFGSPNSVNITNPNFRSSTSPNARPYVSTKVYKSLEES